MENIKIICASCYIIQFVCQSFAQKLWTFLWPLLNIEIFEEINKIRAEFKF